MPFGKKMESGVSISSGTTSEENVEIKFAMDSGCQKTVLDTRIRLE